MLIKLDDGRMKDVPVMDVTPQNYIVPEGEEGDYHVKMEIVSFSPTDGRRLSKPFIQKFDKKIFENVMQRHLSLQGYTFVILHDPTEYLKQKEEEKRQIQAKMKAVRDRSEAQKAKEFEKAVEKAVAAEIAKLSKKSKGKTDADKGTTDR